MDEKDINKVNGIYYTPTKLANYIVSLCVKKNTQTILDPCFGEGVLLLSAYKRMKKKKIKKIESKLYGCDMNGKIKKELRKIMKPENIYQKDFLFMNNNDFNTKFDVIIMNPPYVRHHLILNNKEIKKHLGKNAINIPLTSDLWCFFLIQSMKFLRQKGEIVAILPWSFLFADYSKHIRKILLNQFQQLNIIIFKERFFKKINERIIVLQANGYGGSTLKIKTFYTDDIPKKKINWNKIRGRKDNNSLPFFSVNREIEKIMKDIKKDGTFKKLINYATTHIGIVTGANKFFLKTISEIKKKNLPLDYFHPILKGSKELYKMEIEKKDSINHNILLIPRNITLSKVLKKYIQTGERKGLHKRTHSKIRHPWYTIEIDYIPDGFLHYMTKEIPFIVRNPGKVLSTNTIHNIFLKKNIKRNTLKWIQFSMLTSISQLSIEMVGRTYGGGILKIEPSDADKILIFPGEKKKFPTILSQKINSLLVTNGRKEAMAFVDEWYIKNGFISKTDLYSIKKQLRYLTTIRMGRK